MSDAYAYLPVPEDHYLARGVTNPHITLAYFKGAEPHQVMEAIGSCVLYPHPERETLELAFTGSGVWVSRDHEGSQRWVSYLSVEDTAGPYYLDWMRDYLVRCCATAGLRADDAYRFTPHLTRAVTTDPAEANRLAASTPPSCAGFSADEVWVKAKGSDLGYGVPIRRG